MLEVAITLNQYGLGINKKVLATAAIANDGTGTVTSGNYKYSLHTNGKTIREGRVRGYKRKAHSVWYLLNMVLCDAYGRRN